MDGSSAVCARCGGENPAEARSCAHCGANLTGEHERDARAADLRQLTVMFCDLVGSSELSQRVDPEDYRELLQAYQQACRTTVERYGGHVAQYLGDGVLSYFGYPNALESEAEGAIRAGLQVLAELQRVNGQLGLQGELLLRARIAIHSGIVVVGGLGEGASRETLAVGETINVTARLKELADADTLVVSEDTLRLVPGVFLTRDLGERTLKGIARPVRIYDVVQPCGIRSRLEAAQSMPLVARERELRFLLDRWERAASGSGQALLVWGETGLGKSRLVAALRERLRERPHTWLECHCSPFTMDHTLDPVLQLVDQLFQFGEELKADERIARVERALKRLGIDRKSALPIFEQLLGLPRDERREPFRPPVLETLVTVVLALAARQPAVVLFEDLQWSDPTTLALVERLVTHCADSAVLVLLTARPDFDAPWLERHAVDALALEPLGPEQARELAEQAGGGRLDDALLDEVVERADGVPWFVEEIARAASEAEPSARARPVVPPTIQDSLEARRERLGDARALAQVAAALGGPFSWPLLAAVAERDEEALRGDLQRLVDADLLYRHGAPGHTRYGFRHALLRDVAHESLPKQDRRRLHARIAHVLEERFAELAAHQPQTVARHRLAAGQWWRAAEGFAMAGRQAADTAACREALVHYRNGLDALGHAVNDRERDAKELELQLELGDAAMAVKGYAAPELRSVWQRAIELATALDDAAALSAALTGLTLWWVGAGRCHEALPHARRTLAIAQKSQLPAAALRGHASLALIHLLLGEPDLALDQAERALAAHEPEDHATARPAIGSDPAILASGLAAVAHFLLGRPDRALEDARAGAELAERRQPALGAVMARTFVALVHHLRGERLRALALAERVAKDARELGFHDWLGYGMLLAGASRAHLEGSDRTQHALEGFQSLAAMGAPFGLQLVVETQCQAGQLDAAWATVERALELSRELDQRLAQADLLRLKAELVRERDPDSYQEAETLFKSAVSEARTHGIRSMELRAATGLARLLRDQGRLDEARATLRPLYDAFSEGLATRDLREARAVLDSL